MSLEQIVEITNKCKLYYSLLEGLDLMIRPAPDNDKKEMLKDIIKFGKELSTTFKNFSASNEYLQAINFKVEGQLSISQRRVKELELKLERYKKEL